jgi:hypothetical protein
MKKTDKRIILYLDNQMNKEERETFEKELKNSTELSNEIGSYKNILRSVKVEDEQFHDNEYFQNLVANFRQKNLAVKKSFVLKPAYALAITATVLIFMFILFNPFKEKETDSLDKIIAEMDAAEAAELINYYSDGFSQSEFDQANEKTDSLFAEMISNEFELDEESIKNLVSHDDSYLSSFYSKIEPTETENIYNEILNTKFF